MSETKFNPNDHLMKLRGNAEYLEVKWRLVWFRQDNPNGKIQSTIIEVSDQKAVFQVRVEKEDGGYAEGTGSETPGDFTDYIEKAETKALGRALAMLGYGTQFSPEIEMLNADGTPHVVDAPVQRAGGGSTGGSSFARNGTTPVRTGHGKPYQPRSG